MKVLPVCSGCQLHLLPSRNRLSPLKFDRFHFLGLGPHLVGRFHFRPTNLSRGESLGAHDVTDYF